MRTFLIISGLSGFLSVAIGAFGAHALKDRLDANQMLVTYNTGVQYHMYHTLALLGIAILLALFPQAGMFRWAGWLFVFGIILFSGSLYVMSLSGVKVLGAITPFGGLCFLAGWVMVAWQAWKLTSGVQV